MGLGGLGTKVKTRGRDELSVFLRYQKKIIGKNFEEVELYWVIFDCLLVEEVGIMFFLHVHSGAISLCAREKISKNKRK